MSAVVQNPNICILLNKPENIYIGRAGFGHTHKKKIQSHLMIIKVFGD